MTSANKREIWCRRMASKVALQNTSYGLPVLRLGEDNPGNDNALDGCFPADIAGAFGIVGNPDVIAAVFGLQKSSHENLLHGNRFGKREIVLGHAAFPLRAKTARVLESAHIGQSANQLLLARAA